MEKKFKAIIFDIDGTLTQQIAWRELTVKVGGSIEYNDQQVKNCEDGKISYKEFKQRLIENWSRNGQANKSVFTGILNNIPLRGDAVETVKYLLDRGYQICLITGSFDLYAQTIADKLSVKEWFANTTLVWDDSGNLKDFDCAMDDGARKIEHFQEFLKCYSLTPQECVTVGDSSNDSPLFLMSGNGVAIRSIFEAKELEGIAWQKIQDLSELKKFL
jgi:HAD superfamily phosphoserine phosphatase-like hydrolase